MVIGPGCKIGAGVRLRNTTVFADTTIKPYTYISDSIIGWKNTIGSWVRMTEITCTGEDV